MLSHTITEKDNVQRQKKIFILSVGKIAKKKKIKKQKRKRKSVRLRMSVRIKK